MTRTTVEEKARLARQAFRTLGGSPDGDRQAALARFAELLRERRSEVEEANAKDLEAAQDLVDRGEMRPVLRDRLPLRGPKLEQAAAGVEAVADQPDPLGRTVRATRLDDDLELRQTTVPLGVVACAFESRPDAAVQIIALAVRTGNAVLLKGGSEAAASNHAVAALARDALLDTGLPPDSVQLLEDRSELQDLLTLDHLVDLVVPRGSSDFVRYVLDHTRIPVLGHADGVCHTVLDRDVDLDSALPVCVDAKVDYPAACNATETYLVHEDAASTAVPALVEALRDHDVEVRGDEAVQELEPDVVAATSRDIGMEYGDLIACVRVVPTLQEAIRFVNDHGSGHTDAILTEDPDRGRRFMEAVDSASVMVNASTRFADGYRYGLGAELGISTGKVHARGPVGQEGLTTTKWTLQGDGHTAATYQGEDGRAFQHEPLEDDVA